MMPTLAENAVVQAWVVDRRNKVPVVAAVSVDEAGHPPVYKTLPNRAPRFSLCLLADWAQDFMGDRL